MTFNPNIWPVRLSPSGPFIRDANSGAPLPIGPGSIGIVLRAQGVGSTAASLSSTAQTSICTELDSIPVLGRMPPGFHYDVKAVLSVQAPLAPTPAEPLRAYVEYSEDNGLNWQVFAGARLNTVVNTNGASSIIFEEIDVDRSAAGTLDITHLRLQANSPSGTGGNVSIQPNQTTLRVEQYVTSVVAP